jgi:hypothetical protein
MGHGRSKWKTLTLVAVAICFGAYFARMPWEVYRQQRAKANQSLAEAQVNDIQRISLMKREAELKSPIGREKIAREHGYLHTGEKPYNVGSSTP